MPSLPHATIDELRSEEGGRVREGFRKLNRRTSFGVSSGGSSSGGSSSSKVDGAVNGAVSGRAPSPPARRVVPAAACLMRYCDTASELARAVEGREEGVWLNWYINPSELDVAAFARAVGVSGKVKQLSLNHVHNKITRERRS